MFCHFNVWMWVGLMKEDNTMPDVTGRELESDRVLSTTGYD
jgi:hypothetical protein